jgi:hypothetical protein
MNMRSKPVRIFSAIVYAVGLVFGMTFLSLYVWANIEASLFTPAISGDENLRSLQCPMVITEDEVAVIRATLDNPLDRDINRLARVHISEGMVTLMRQVNTQVELAPGETRTVEWEAYPEDAAFERLILVRAYIFRTAPLPAQSASCGILVINAPLLSGNQIALITAIGSFIGMGVGSYVWMASSRSFRESKQRHLAVGMVWLFIFMTIGIALSFFGMWQMAFVMLFITFVILLGIITYVLLGY